MVNTGMGKTLMEAGVPPHALVTGTGSGVGAARMRAALADVRPTALVHAAGLLLVGALGAQDRAAGGSAGREHYAASKSVVG